MNKKIPYSITKQPGFPACIAVILAALLLSGCSDSAELIAGGEPAEDTRLSITLENGFINADICPMREIRAGEHAGSEDFIGQVSLYVFQGDSPVRLKDVRYENGKISAVMPSIAGTLSAFVIANENIEAPTSKQDLQARMARTVIGQGGIPATGMPMGSSETTFRISPTGQTNVRVNLMRCHSAIYIETPTGRNKNYRISLTGEQRNQGALVDGSRLLAPAATNNTGRTQGYPLSDVASREPVAYYYPTDGEITITIQPVNAVLPPQNVTLRRNEAGLRNRKYILRILPGATDGNTKSKDSLRITLIEEN